MSIHGAASARFEASGFHLPQGCQLPLSHSKSHGGYRRTYYLLQQSYSSWQAVGEWSAVGSALRKRRFR